VRAVERPLVDLPAPPDDNLAMDQYDDRKDTALAGKLVEIIETRAGGIARAWYRDVKESSYTPSFKHISEKDALEIVNNVYRKLGYWLHPDSEHEVRDTYEIFGQSMYHKGLQMEEVVMTLVLIKRYLWLHLLEEGLMTTDLAIYQALELNNKVVLYFDRAIYFALRGYREARARARTAAAS